jgi:hypothetical protein
MPGIAALSPGTKLILAAGAILFLDLFMTWQRVAVDFGSRIQVTRDLDAWDFWGLLIGLLTLGLLAAVIVRHANDELALGSRWELLVLVLSSLVLALAVIKNFRDSDSTLASYLGVLLAGVMTLGASLDWTRARHERHSSGTPWWVQPTEPSGRSAAVDSDQPRARW